MAPQPFAYDRAQTLPPSAMTRAGYTFAGWNTAANGSGTAYADQASVVNLSPVDGATVPLYAQWRVVPVPSGEQQPPAGLPNTGGPDRWVLTSGIVLLLAGATIALGARRRTR